MTIETAALADSKEHPEIAAFAETVARVKNIVESETDALRQHDTSCLARFSRLKDEGLFELTRRARRLEAFPKSDELGSQMNALREALSDNQAQLTIHLNAIGAIADAMLRAVADEDSDKTYSGVNLTKGRSK